MKVPEATPVWAAEVATETATAEGVIAHRHGYVFVYLNVGVTSVESKTQRNKRLCKSNEFLEQTVDLFIHF